MARCSNRLVVAVVAVAASFPAYPAPVTTPNTPGIKWLMCDEPGNAVKFRQPAGTTDLIISCTQTSTNLTLKGCVGPRVKKIDGVYQISCNALIVP